MASSCPAHGPVDDTAVSILSFNGCRSTDLSLQLFGAMDEILGHSTARWWGNLQDVGGAMQLRVWADKGFDEKGVARTEGSDVPTARELAERSAEAAAGEEASSAHSLSSLRTLSKLRDRLAASAEKIGTLERQLGELMAANTAAAAAAAAASAEGKHDRRGATAGAAGGGGGSRLSNGGSGRGGGAWSAAPMTDREAVARWYRHDGVRALMSAQPGRAAAATATELEDEGMGAADGLGRWLSRLRLRALQPKFEAAGVHSLRHLAQMDATALDTLLATAT
eukprot:SAG11_NODE_6888_length_1231_cov_0.928445_1_plen_280_part_01